MIVVSNIFIIILVLNEIFFSFHQEIIINYNRKPSKMLFEIYNNKGAKRKSKGCDKIHSTNKY